MFKKASLVTSQLENICQQFVEQTCEKYTNFTMRLLLNLHLTDHSAQSGESTNSKEQGNEKEMTVNYHERKAEKIVVHSLAERTVTGKRKYTPKGCN